MFVLAAMTVTLHDVLVATVTWKLVAHPAGGGGGRNKQWLMVKHVVYTESEMKPTHEIYIAQPYFKLYFLKGLILT